MLLGRDRVVVAASRSGSFHRQLEAAGRALVLTHDAVPSSEVSCGHLSAAAKLSRDGERPTPGMRRCRRALEEMYLAARALPASQPLSVTSFPT